MLYLAALLTEVVNPQIDTGQLIVAGSIAIATWFIRREVISIGRRLEKHEDRIEKIAGDVQRLIGMSNYWTGRERRK